MDKFERAEGGLYEALDIAYTKIDADIGRIKRDAKNAGSYSTGATVSEIARTCVGSANELAAKFEELYNDRRKPLVLHRKKFDDIFQENMNDLFNDFSKYCYEVIEEASIVTNQKHMYGKEYPGLHQALESIKSKLAAVRSPKQTSDE